MGFSGMRAAILVVLLVVLVIGVTKFDLPGWLVAVGLILGSAVLKGWEKKASS